MSAPILPHLLPIYNQQPPTTPSPTKTQETPSPTDQSLVNCEDSSITEQMCTAAPNCAWERIPGKGKRYHCVAVPVAPSRSPFKSPTSSVRRWCWLYSLILWTLDSGLVYSSLSFLFCFIQPTKSPVTAQPTTNAPTANVRKSLLVLCFCCTSLQVRH